MPDDTEQKRSHQGQYIYELVGALISHGIVHDHEDLSREDLEDEIAQALESIELALVRLPPVQGPKVPYVYDPDEPF